jgi:hypothetical protein
VARLAGDRAGVALAQGAKECARDVFIEGKARRELDEEARELRAEPRRLARKRSSGSSVPTSLALCMISRGSFTEKLKPSGTASAHRA